MTSFRGFLTDLLLVIGAIAVALAAVSVVLALVGHPGALLEWARRAGGARADWITALKNACPLILTGLAAGVAFRAGVFNIGAEGQSILGSLAAVAVATRWLPNLTTPWMAIPTILLIAALGGAFWALVPAILDRWRGVPIVLSTILLNFVAYQLLGLLLEGSLKTAATQVPQSGTLPDAYLLPVLVQHAGASVHAGILVALAIAALSWLVQARTAVGFEMLVTGLNPTAAKYAGMPVAARQFGIMLCSGAFAGLAGAIQLMGVEGGHSLNTAPSSYGYAGIAVALLGRLHPAGIVAAAIFFALLDHGADNLEFSTALPHQISDIVKGLIVIVILAGTAYVARRRSTALER